MTSPQGTSASSTQSVQGQRVGIQSVDPAGGTAVGLTRYGSNCTIQLDYHVGAAHVIPCVGEQWFVKRLAGFWILERKLPYNTTVQNNVVANPVQGTYQFGSSGPTPGPTNLMGSQINAMAPLKLFAGNSPLPEADTVDEGSLAYDGTSPVFSKGSSWVNLATAAEAGTAYIKPAGGIPATDLSAAVQTQLALASTALQSVPPSNTVSLTRSSVSPLTLGSTYQAYVFIGTTGIWTLPPVSGNTGQLIDVYNQGTGLLTLQHGGSDSIINQGIISTSLSIGINGSVSLVNTGTAWTVKTSNLPSPAYDNSTMANLSAASGVAATLSHLVAAGQPYGIVEVVGSGMSTAATPVVTFGGVTLTSLGSQYQNNGSGTATPWIWVFGGAGIPSGAQTVSVKFTQSGTVSGFFSSYTYLNVSQVGTLQKAYGATAAQSVSVTPTRSPSMVWGSICDANGPFAESYTSPSFTVRQGGSVGNGSQNWIAGDVALSGTSAFTFGATDIAQAYAAVALPLY